MQHKLIIYSLLFILSSFSEFQHVKEPKTELPFKDGEWFEFRIYYGIFNASYASLSLEKKKLHGKEVFHAKGYGCTTGLARWFFKVEDHYETYFDAENGLPYKFIRDIDEGGYTKNVEIQFDHESQLAQINDKKKKKQYKNPIKQNAQHLLSSFNNLRNKNTKEEIKPIS